LRFYTENFHDFFNAAEKNAGLDQQGFSQIDNKGNRKAT
jgi:hypothetical protein